MSFMKPGYLLKEIGRVRRSRAILETVVLIWCRNDAESLNWVAFPLGSSW
jgi:hypothetical protein